MKLDIRQGKLCIADRSTQFKLRLVLVSTVIRERGHGQEEDTIEPVHMSERSFR